MRVCTDYIWPSPGQLQSLQTVVSAEISYKINPIL
jgi:hypothetical protein